MERHIRPHIPPCRQLRTFYNFIDSGEHWTSSVWCSRPLHDLERPPEATRHALCAGRRSTSALLPILALHWKNSRFKICSSSSSSRSTLMKHDKRTRHNIKWEKNWKTDTEGKKIQINQWKKIIKTQSINVREQHSKYKVLFHNSINIRSSPVKIRFNPKKIARKGFSTVSGTISDGE